MRRAESWTRGSPTQVPGARSSPRSRSASAAASPRACRTPSPGSGLRICSRSRACTSRWWPGSSSRRRARARSRAWLAARRDTPSRAGCGRGGRGALRAALRLAGAGAPVAVAGARARARDAARAAGRGQPAAGGRLARDPRRRAAGALRRELPALVCGERGPRDGAASRAARVPGPHRARPAQPARGVRLLGDGSSRDRSAGGAPARERGADRAAGESGRDPLDGSRPASRLAPLGGGGGAARGAAPRPRARRRGADRGGLAGRRRVGRRLVPRSGRGRRRTRGGWSRRAWSRSRPFAARAALRRVLLFSPRGGARPSRPGDGVSAPPRLVRARCRTGDALRYRGGAAPRWWMRRRQRRVVSN